MDKINRVIMTLEKQEKIIKYLVEKIKSQGFEVDITLEKREKIIKYLTEKIKPQGFEVDMTLEKQEKQEKIIKYLIEKTKPQDFEVDIFDALTSHCLTVSLQYCTVSRIYVTDNINDVDQRLYNIILVVNEFTDMDIIDYSYLGESLLRPKIITV